MLHGRKSVLVAKIEGTIGTDATPGATDGAFNVLNAVVAPQFEMEEREAQGSGERQAAVASMKMGRATFTTEVQWDGSATEPAWAETFFPACGWVKSGQVYYPKLEPPGTNVKTLTIAQYVGGTGTNESACRKIVGASGTFTAVLTASKRILFNWEFLGVWAGDNDATPPAPTYPTSTVYQWRKGACTWNSVAWSASQATVNANNTLVPIQRISGDEGIGYVAISDRYPRITINPLKVLNATQDRHSAWEDGLEYPLALYAGGVGNSQFKIDAPKAQVMNITYADREGLVVDDAELACNKNGTTADQSLYFTFTAAT